MPKLLSPKLREMRYIAGTMLRVRSIFMLLSLALVSVSSSTVLADAPAKAAVAAPEEDQVDKEIERLYGEGKYDAAFALAEKLVATREETLGKEHVRTGLAIADLGALHLAKGNAARAEPLLKRAVEILEKGNAQEEWLATALSNLASAYMARGDVKGAEELILRAMAIEEKGGAARESAWAVLLGKLGGIHMATGRTAQAEKEFLRALAIHEKRGPERSVLNDLGMLGALYRAISKEQQAVAAFNRAVPLAERLLGLDHPDVGRLYHKVAIYLTASHQYDQAEREYRRAEANLLKSLGPDHPDTGNMYSDWAVLLTRTTQQKRALELREKAQLIEEKWLAHALASGTDEDKLSYAAQLERTMDRVVSFQMGMNLGDREATRFVLQTILRNKAQALEATAASTRALRERMTPESKKQFDDLVRVRGQLASMYTRGPRGKTVTEFNAETEKLAREADAIDSALSTQSAAYRQSTREVTIESVAARIPKDAALVEFVQYRHYNSHFYSASSERELTPRMMVYILRNNGSIYFLPISNSNTLISDKVARIRKGMQDPSDTKFYRELSLLHDVIFIRLTHLLPDVKHLLISPDGDLSLLPFGALINRDGHFLAQQYTITYLSSGRDLLRIGERDVKSGPSMLLANPDYDAPSDAPQEVLPDAPSGSLPVLARAKFPPLPGTAEEADVIRKIIPDPQVRLQRIATETQLKNVAGPKILHIATHGFFLDESGTAYKGSRGLELNVPAKLLPTVPSQSEETGAEKIKAPNPMFLSGLALAGANVRKGQTDDGILTAYEASALNLLGTELVVLSACETGIGSRVAREGVRGLRRALVLAGAETQVMSLWQVDDGATRDLMTLFYRNMFHKGMGRSESMRAAQLNLLQQPATKHPFYWASFIVSGNWQPISGVVPSSGDADSTESKGKSVTTPPGGAKGCGCRIKGDLDEGSPMSLILVAVAFASLRRRSKQIAN